MERKIFCILLASALALLLLSACTRGPAGATQCLTPYLQKGDDCCLDKNENNICDEEETSKVTAVVKDRPVIAYEEVCDATSRFECIDRKITSDYVWLKLRSVRDETVQVKRITLTDFNCAQDFELPAINYNSIQEFKIPCVLDKDIVRSKLIIDADVQTYLRYSNGQVYGLTEPRAFTFAGVISGFVQP